ETRRPGALAVVASLNFRILEVVIELPALRDQLIAQLPGPLPARFELAGIEPDLERQFFRQPAHHPAGNAFVPPDRGREYGEPVENVRKPKPEGEGGQSA